jgi:hypothetical protein
VDADSEATAAGIDLSSYKHRVYVLPVTTCSWAGRANVGCGTFCRSWIDTCSLPDVYAHELGHNLSMRHASTDTDNDGVVNSNYGDVSDFMGSGGYGWRQVNGPHVLEMGWLPSSQVIDANHQGTQNFVISPLDTDPASAAYPQLIRIPRPGEGDDIFLSYRRRLGHDAGLRTEYVDKTSVHSHDDPGTATMFIKALDDGQQFDDPSIGLSVVQLSHDDLSATLQVSLPVIGCGADADGDGVCDVDDACPLDPENDADADGVCGNLDCDSSNPGAFATPAVVVGVLAESISGGHRFSWIEQASTAGSNTSYDVYSGSLSSMPSLAGDFSQGSCDLENTTSPTFDHLGLDPTTGETFYFLVRAQNGCPGGTGTFGDLQRDATAASSASVCPE